MRAVSEGSLCCKDRYLADSPEQRASQEEQEFKGTSAEGNLQNGDHITFPFGQASMGAGLALSGGANRGNWGLRVLSCIYSMITAQWGRQANFQEEKLMASPCLIIPSSNKVALCFQVAPGRSWVVIYHSGELDDKCHSGGGMTHCAK